MLTTSRPIKGKDFFDRRVIIQDLHTQYRLKQNVALCGIRRIGKSSIAEEFLDQLKKKDDKVLCVYFQVHHSIGSPAFFGLKLLAIILEVFCKQFSIQTDEDFSLLQLDVRRLKNIADTIKSQKLSSLSDFLIVSFPFDHGEERIIFERILEFLEHFAEEKDIQIAIVLDEFQDILALNKFEGFKPNRVLSVLDGTFSRQQHIWYCLTGSTVRMMDKILEDKDSPFYGRFRKIEVKGFEESDAKGFISKVLENPLTGDALNLIVNTTGGNPFYIVSICNTIQLFIMREHEKSIINKKTVEEAIVFEIKEGTLSSHCNQILESSLSRASRSTSLKEAVRIIALKGFVTPSELARDTGRDIGEVSPILKDLQKIDLVKKVDKKYVISDPILSLWIEAVYEPSEPRIDKIQKFINKNYDELIAKLKTQRGFLIESYFRELLSKFDNTPFHDIFLPRFDSIEPLNIFDQSGEIFGNPSNVEVDALCIGSENWICEFKYQKESVRNKDLILLEKKKNLIEQKLKININNLSFISVSNFTEEALDQAKSSKIWCIDPKILNELIEKYHMRKLEL